LVVERLFNCRANRDIWPHLRAINAKSANCGAIAG
jgi:hypothetical protein